jgi:hypothetical protein
MYEPLCMCHINWQIYIFMIDILLKLNEFCHLLGLEHDP